MKVSRVVIHFKTETGFINPYSAVEGAAVADLHYIVRDGMATVNYKQPDGVRKGNSFPVENILEVETNL